MKKAFVSGAMSSDNILEMLENIHDGIKLGAELLELGYAPYVAHLDILFKIQNGKELNVPLQTYYDYTLEWLKASDLVVLCPNWENSKGVKRELEVAKARGIPIYYSIEELKITHNGFRL